ncbi:hypothetical protein [Streptomyces dysideae]|uniref:Uncharacterized protein n=1 Tax=Streptomyces dysideae TaxID=909626 RepID=A0A101UU38_9ACTN|nr:hypothetical protein [Streptomyces dysideae]KUO16876.1 hypothetical protein AQJ91_33165 [Streptomyces dysideae]
MAGLLGVLAEDYDPDAARAELAGWIAAHGEREGALRQLTDAVRTMTFRTRAQAMLDVLLAALPDGEGERLLCTLRRDTQLAPLALNALAHRELLSPEDMTDAEYLLVLAESLLQLVELAGGGDGAEEVLRAQVPRPGTRLPPRWTPRTRTGPGSTSSGSWRHGHWVPPAPASAAPGRLGAPQASAATSDAADRATPPGPPGAGCAAGTGTGTGTEPGAGKPMGPGLVRPR